MRTTALAILILLVLPGCVGTRGAPLVNIINVEQPQDDEVAVRQAPPRRPYRR